MEKKADSDAEKFREEIRIWMGTEFDKAFKDLEDKKPKEATYIPLKVLQKRLQVLHMSTEVLMANKHNNKVDFDETYDFTSVKQILVSKETKCPFKSGYSYVTVILWVDGANYMMFPYVYKEKIKGKGKNNLKQWAFVNKNMQSASHAISSFQHI